MKYDNILIVNTFGIGDVIFSTPLLKAIRANLPDSKIYYLCNRRNHDLLKNDRDIDGLIVYEKDELREVLKRSKLKFLKEISGIIGRVRRLRIDVAIDLTLNYQICTILLLAGIHKRVGFNYKNRGFLLTHKVPLESFRSKHVSEYYLYLLDVLGLRYPEDRRLYAYSSDADKVSADDFIRKNGISGKRLVGMVAGAGKSWGAEAFYRRWDPENFAYVGRGLCLSGDIRVIIFGTGEESKICDFIVKSIGCGAISLCGATSLGFLVEMMSRCELVLCNEGGPLHIAVSQDVKTISIFGPVDDKVYGPYPASEKHIVVRAEGVECRPCYTNFKHAVCDDRKCLKNISKEKVLELAKRSLGL